MEREIITIDEKKCNGCGSCVPGCPEGALQIIDGKARLVSDLFCDGLGACIGDCPEGAISVETREAAPYGEAIVMNTIIAAGPNTIKAHLKHLRDHDQQEYFEQALAILLKKGLPIPKLDEDSCPSGDVRAPQPRAFPILQKVNKRQLWEVCKVSCGNGRYSYIYTILMRHI